MDKKKMNKQGYYLGTGRRKSSVARVRIIPGEGLIKINGRDSLDYFKKKILVMDLEQPLVLTETKNKFDILVNVNGGGLTGQAGAVRLGISRALMEFDLEYRPLLKENGMITRDARIKERKKYGRRGARRGMQFSKR